MSYAEHWNNNWSGPRCTAPTTIWVDGVFEEFEEHTIAMDTDEDYTALDPTALLDDIQSGRKMWQQGAGGFSSELMNAMEMDVDDLHFSSPVTGTPRLIVIDTNVLVSRLPLLKELVEALAQSNIALLIPGVVIQELDGLRNCNRTNKALRADGTMADVSVSSLARKANDWLLPLVNRTPHIRGQKLMESPRGNWMYERKGMQNDDLIIECAGFYTKSNGLLPANAKIFTYDKNLQLKAGIEGYGCLSPPGQCTAQQLLAQLDGPAAESFASASNKRRPQQADWARAPQPPRKKKSRENRDPVAPSMDLDEDKPFAAPTIPAHPLSLLHDQLRAYLIAELPGVVAEGVEHLRHEKANVSIHALHGRPPIPKEGAWLRWTPRESILWLDKVLPKDGSLPENAGAKLGEFVTEYGKAGGRRGRDWGRGDWMAACDALRRFCGPSVSADLKTAVEQAYNDHANQPPMR